MTSRPQITVFGLTGTTLVGETVVLGTLVGAVIQDPEVANYPKDGGTGSPVYL